MLSVSHTNMFFLAEDRGENHLARAAVALERATQLDPNLFNTRMATGYYYYQGKLDYERALEQFEIAKKLKPGAMDSYASIGYVQRRQGKWEDCLKNLKHALKLDPRSSLLALEIGETMVDLSRYDEAEEYFDRALTLAPDMTAAHALKSLMYLYQGDLERGRRTLEVAPVEPWFTDWAWCRFHFLNRDFEKSLGLLQATQLTAVSQHFFYTPIDELIAQAYLALGDTARARVHFDSSRVALEALIDVDSTDARFHSALGIAYAGVGRKADAIREGKLGIELMPVSKDSKRGPPRHEAMACIYMLIGDYDAAVDELEFILSKPASPTRVPLIRIDPTWDPLRGHPRFQKLIE
jgi:serine/threonine-protein kinase